MPLEAPSSTHVLLDIYYLSGSRGCWSLCGATPVQHRKPTSCSGLWEDLGAKVHVSSLSFLNPNEMFDPNISSGQGHSSILHIAPRLRGYCAKRGITGGSTRTSVASRFFSALSPVCLTIAGRAAYGQCEEAVR